MMSSVGISVLPWCKCVWVGEWHVGLGTLRVGQGFQGREDEEDGHARSCGDDDYVCKDGELCSSMASHDGGPGVPPFLDIT